MSKGCLQAEIWAGAIALGEASDDERGAYRLHLSACARCVTLLGGEREIERVMQTVATARDAETWAPDVRTLRVRRGSRLPMWRWAFLGTAAAAAVVLSLRLQTAETTNHTTPVVSQIAELTPSQRDERSIAALRNVGTVAAPTVRAESLALMPKVPRAGLTTAIGGTTGFQVRVDAHGRPTQCTIVKSSSYGMLDRAVCEAAMQAHYAPRTLDGKPVATVYRDAFTFHTGAEH
jgi:TonB family protein